MSSGNDTTTGTLTSPSIHTPTIPSDLVSEILCRLPVKLLLQLKCICKSWKSLIADPKFAKKHLLVSKTYHHNHHLIVNGRDSLLWDSTISSIFSDASTTSRVPQLQLIRPEAIDNMRDSSHRVSSCDGMLLIPIDQHHALLWNPSIRKFRNLPPLLNPRVPLGHNPHYTFGYDHFIDNYKVFAVTRQPSTFITNHFGVREYTRNPKKGVSVYTLGTDSWRRIDNFPYDGPPHGPRIFVSGTVNWLAYAGSSRFSMFIVSLDLENELYQTLLMPDFEKTVYSLSTLGVLRDCLCFFANEGEFFDVWVMTEYEIKESWTKLFSIHYEGGIRSFAYTKVVYVYEDDQVLLDYKELYGFKSDLKLVVYNYKNGTSKIPRIRNINSWMVPEVYVESLISP